MLELHVRTDKRALASLPGELREIARDWLRRCGERGAAIMREEVPGGAESKMAKGVKVEFNFADERLSAAINVTAISERPAQQATLHLPSGKTRAITLRATRPFNYAQAVIEGTGLYGPRHTPIKPRSASVLLIPVNTMSSLDSKSSGYIEANGQKYIVRPRSSGTRPNPFGERTAQRLESEISDLFDQAFGSEDRT
jgi:hypothetical protein